jgi:predicted deacetylase
MKVHVSIHDVSPAYEAQVFHLLDLCHARGLKPALLVVPNFHERAPLADSKVFVDAVRSLGVDHELFLHGYTHRAAERSGVRSFVDQRIVSAGEGEFSHLTVSECATLVGAGERVMRELGLRIDGFVPPAWVSPEALVEVLAARGYAYTEDHLTVQRPATGESWPSLVVNFASRSQARAITTALFSRLSMWFSLGVRTRVALHPTDLRVPFLHREIARLLDWASEQQVSTSDQFLSD